MSDTTNEPRREWTQFDILEETRRRHPSGEPGFFNTLGEVADEAFGGKLEYPEFGEYELDMGELTVGDIIDFFVKRSEPITIMWHNESGAGPCAYITTDSQDTASALNERFGNLWLSPDQKQDREDEDTGRASGHHR